MPTYSTRVLIRHSTISASQSSPNTDGVEPITNGDDRITVKSGSTNVLVENIHCKGSHGITVGSIWDDDVTNVTYRNCTLEDCGAGPRIKGRSQGNATIRDVRFENIKLHGRVQKAIQVNMDYETPGSKTNNTGVTAQNASYVNISGSSKTAASILCDSR